MMDTKLEYECYLSSREQIMNEMNVRRDGLSICEFYSGEMTQNCT